MGSEPKRFRIRGTFETFIEMTEDDYECSIEEIVAAARANPEDWATTELVAGDLVEFDIVPWEGR